MKSEDLLRAQGAVLADAVRLLAGLPGSSKQSQYASLRRVVATGIWGAASGFSDPHTVVALQALGVKQDFEQLMSSALNAADTVPRQIELAKLAVTAASEGHWASFRGLEALLEVRPMPFAEGDKLAEMISRAYEALARGQELLSTTR